ncbi:MAG TPA: hypothetical protein VF826_04310, partial [Chloroflexia bacterium]
PAEADKTATAHAVQTMLSQPSGGGGAAAPTSVAGPSPTSADDPDPVGDPPDEADGPDPVERQAEFAYPRRMQVDKPATVRLTVFTGGYEPLGNRNSEVAQPNLDLEVQVDPGITVRLTGELELDGAEIVKDPGAGTQELSDSANKWEWRITAPEKQEIRIRPLLWVEYVDQAGKVQHRYQALGDDIYTVTDVEAEGVAPVVGSWLGDNLVGLLGLVMGVPGTITTIFSLRKGNKPN